MEQYVATMMVRIVRALAGPGWSPTRVRLMTRRIDPLGREWLGDPDIELGAPITAVYLAPSVLASPVPRAVVPGVVRPPQNSRGPAAEHAADLVGALRVVFLPSCRRRLGSTGARTRPV